MPGIEVKWPSENEESITTGQVISPQFALAGVAAGETQFNYDEVSDGEGGGDSSPQSSEPSGDTGGSNGDSGSQPENTPEPSAPVVSDGAPSAPSSVDAAPKPKRQMPKLPGTPVIVIAVLVLALLVLGFQVMGLSSENSKLKADKKALNDQITQLNANPQGIIQKQTNDLVATVSKLMQLPSGETPTVAQVTDVAAAKQQSAFFNDAQNGDKVLMYVKAGEAVLYRPSTNKIVLVAPLTFTNNASTPAKATATKH